MTFKEFLTKKGISDSGFEGMTAKEVSDLQSEYYDERFKSIVTQKDLTDFKSEIGKMPTSDDVEALKTSIEEALDEIAQVKESTTYSMRNTDKYQLRKMIEEKHEDIVDAVKNGKPLEFTFKAAAEMHRTDNSTVTGLSGDNPSFGNIAIDNDIVSIRVPEHFILNMISNRQVSKVPKTRLKIEQGSKAGNVGLTEEGNVKRLKQYTFYETISKRIKFAGRIEWTEEFEMDYEALLTEIVRMFERDVMLSWQEGLLTQIRGNATAYVSSKLDGTFSQPDNGLAVVAGKAQLMSLNFSPDVVAINPADFFPIMFQQNDKGDLKVSHYISNGKIAGMTLIMSNVVPEGKALIGEKGLYKEEHTDFILRSGQYGKQLIENKYTMIGEVFSLLSIAEIDKNGWLELDLDVVKSVLKK